MKTTKTLQLAVSDLISQIEQNRQLAEKLGHKEVAKALELAYKELLKVESSF